MSTQSDTMTGPATWLKLSYYRYSCSHIDHKQRWFDKRKRSCCRHRVPCRRFCNRPVSHCGNDTDNHYGLGCWGRVIFCVKCLVRNFNLYDFEKYYLCFISASKFMDQETPKLCDFPVLDKSKFPSFPERPRGETENAAISTCISTMRINKAITETTKTGPKSFRNGPMGENILKNFFRK